MKPTDEQIINWGREALNKTGDLIPTEWNLKLLDALCSIVYEEGRKDEREACAKVAESYEPRCDTCPSGVSLAIRERGQG